MPSKNLEKQSGASDKIERRQPLSWWMMHGKRKQMPYYTRREDANHPPFLLPCEDRHKE